MFLLQRDKTVDNHYKRLIEIYVCVWDNMGCYLPSKQQSKSRGEWMEKILVSAIMPVYNSNIYLECDRKYRKANL